MLTINQLSAGQRAALAIGENVSANSIKAIVDAVIAASECGFIRKPENDACTIAPKKQCPVIWTGCADADLALTLIERLDVDSDEQDRLNQIEQLVSAMGRMKVSAGKQEQSVSRPVLAPEHKGMRISATGLLSGVGGRLKAGARQLSTHLVEMAERYYAGDLAVVDEFLQLYALDDKRPK